MRYSGSRLTLQRELLLSRVKNLVLPTSGYIILVSAKRGQKTASLAMVYIARDRNFQPALTVTSSALIPTYIDVFLQISWNNWHTRVESERFFDDFLKVFHLVQVLKCGRTVRTLKYPLQLFICLILEENNIQSHRSNDRNIDVIPSENENSDWFQILITFFV